ncbi:SDR family oxidoreductase [Paraferrimonas sedimenticola]|uniref:Short-chain dehydrogenase n=1 Tax=Paraferrimonas sedimenticola TaxID=375674 RepID=A0AA37RTW1_9GAMM|nr:SDR family oxidoreductase [Paraferrimonas sedimenticola]GLP95226.1 short-chain dehydrogenase [Paraferrimonas sedimenticola]
MKRVLITGANRGIGLEFVRRYLALGWEVIATSRHRNDDQPLAKLAKLHGKQLTWLTLEVTQAESRAALKAWMGEQPLDLFINNAGIYGPKRVELGEVDGEDMAQVLAVNSVAPLMMVQNLLPNLVKAKGKIAILSSKMGSMGDNNSGGAYAYRASKAAVNAVSLSLAKDLVDDDVTVVVLHPGWVKTDMGGPNAFCLPQDSVYGMIEQINATDLTNTGRFVDYCGNEIPW